MVGRCEAGRKAGHEEEGLGRDHPQEDLMAAGVCHPHLQRGGQKTGLLGEALPRHRAGAVPWVARLRELQEVLSAADLSGEEHSFIYLYRKLLKNEFG